MPCGDSKEKKRKKKKKGIDLAVLFVAYAVAPRPPPRMLLRLINGLKNREIRPSKYEPLNVIDRPSHPTGSIDIRTTWPDSIVGLGSGSRTPAAGRLRNRRTTHRKNNRTKQNARRLSGDDDRRPHRSSRRGGSSSPSTCIRFRRHGQASRSTV